MNFGFEFSINEDESKLKTAVVIEDQPIIWDYAKSCLSGYFNVAEFCSNTKEAELAIKKHKPDLVWLDCYLGELSENTLGVKNSGMQIASWIKNLYPETKIFLFTASNELAILDYAKKIGIEGLALGGKFIKDKSIVIEGIRALYYDFNWTSPNVFETLELEAFSNITVLEFAIVSMLLIGKNTNQLADELDMTRKQVNNAIYRVKEKLCLDTEISRRDFLEEVKDKIMDSFDVSQFYNLTELVSVNAVIESSLKPILEQIKTQNTERRKISEFNA